MPIPDEQIIRQNPWWTNENWERQDPHLQALEEQPLVFPTDPLADVDLERKGTYIIRGPRQVGKSTDLKRLIGDRMATFGSPRDVIYLALDLIEDQDHRELYTSVTRAKDLAGSSEGGLLLLDEVTGVRRWQTAIKSLWDDGVIREDAVLCTGSSAIDLRRGASERLPGRRGRGDDILVLPQSLSTVARALDDTVPESPQLALADLVTDEGRDLLRSMQPYLPSLGRALERYVVFGGLPAAIAELLAGEAEPSRDVKRVVHDSLVKEIAKRGASIPASHALLERVVRSLSSKTNWTRIAEEMGGIALGRRSRQGRHPHHATVREYLELLADGYFLVILYFWRAGAHSNSISNDKKLYFFDPLLHTVARDYAPGLPFDQNAAVENVLATHLLRRYEPKEQLLETPAEPQGLHVWATSSGEIDFICGPWADRAALEAKYGKVRRRIGANVAKAHPGRPAVVASKDELLLDSGDYVIAPAALIGWALGT
jgi:uncharacterized protein